MDAEQDLGGTLEVQWECPKGHKMVDHSDSCNPLPFTAHCFECNIAYKWGEITVIQNKILTPEENS